MEMTNDRLRFTLLFKLLSLFFLNPDSVYSTSYGEKIQVFLKLSFFIFCL